MRLKRSEARRYRNPSPAILTTFALGVDVVMISQVVGGAGHHTTAGTIFAVLFVLLLTPISLRTAWAGVFASRDKIHVRNVFGSFDLRWEEVERFDIGQSGFFPQVCRIHARDGRVLRALGIQENNIALVRPKAKRPAQRLVSELNEELAKRISERGLSYIPSGGQGLGKSSDLNIGLTNSVLALSHDSESFVLAWLLIGALLLLSLWFLVPRLMSNRILGGGGHGDAAVAASNEAWAPGCPARGVPPVESVRPAYLASVHLDVEETMHGRHGALYGAGVVDSEEPWSDSEPQRHFISRSKDGRIPGAFEMRWWAPNGDDIVADAFDFGTTQQAQDFFARAASQRCRDAGEQTMVPSPVGARDIAWINPDDARQVDVYLIRGRRVYRIADAPGGTRADSKPPPAGRPMISALGVFAGRLGLRSIEIVARTVGAVIGQLVIFDCDGVLVDSEVISNDVLARALCAEELPTTLAEARRDYQGLLLSEVVLRAEARLGQALPEGWLASYERDRTAAFRRDLRPVPGAAEAVRHVIERRDRCVRASRASREDALVA